MHSDNKAVRCVTKVYDLDQYTHAVYLNIIEEYIRKVDTYYGLKCVNNVLFTVKSLIRHYKSAGVPFPRVLIEIEESLSNYFNFLKTKFELESAVKRTKFLQSIDRVSTTKPDNTSFEDFLLDEGKGILPYLKEEYYGAKTKRVCLMLFALRDKGYVVPEIFSNKSKLYRVLCSTFGNGIGNRAGYNAWINKLDSASASEEVGIATERRVISQLEKKIKTDNNSK